MNAMNIKNMESTTLSAINKLVELEMPFAAATLCYVMVERCLKLYLLQKRNNLAKNDIDISAKVGSNKLRFKDHANADESTFVDKFLNTIQLGGLEIVFRIQAQGIKDARNKLIHSGFYLDQEKNMSSEDRQSRNWHHYEIAAKHLSYCSNNCFKNPINFNETSKLLKFES
jgi:hypothetical protein